MGKENGVILRIYTRQVMSAEEEKMISNAVNKPQGAGRYGEPLRDCDCCEQSTGLFNKKLIEI